MIGPSHLGEPFVVINTRSSLTVPFGKNIKRLDSLLLDTQVFMCLSNIASWGQHFLTYVIGGKDALIASTWRSLPDRQWTTIGTLSPVFWSWSISRQAGTCKCFVKFVKTARLPIFNSGDLYNQLRAILESGDPIMVATIDRRRVNNCIFLRAWDCIKTLREICRACHVKRSEIVEGFEAVNQNSRHIGFNSFLPFGEKFLCVRLKKLLSSQNLLMLWWRSHMFHILAVWFSS